MHTTGKTHRLKGQVFDREVRQAYFRVVVCHGSKPDLPRKGAIEMRKLAVLLAAVPAAVALIVVLIATPSADAIIRNPEESPQVPQVPTVTVAREIERNVEAGGYIGYVVRMESAQRVLGPFRLEDDCSSAARLLNGARPNAFACRAERQ